MTASTPDKLPISVPLSPFEVEFIRSMLLSEYQKLLLDSPRAADDLFPINWASMLDKLCKRFSQFSNSTLDQ